MQPQRTKPSGLELFIGALVGALVGLTLALWIGEPAYSPGPRVVPNAGRYGPAGTVFPDGPLYVLLPAIGAFLGFAWILFRRSPRE